MITHPDMTGRLIKHRVDALTDDARTSRKATRPNVIDVELDGAPGSRSILSEIELTFWKRWRVRRRPAHGPA